MNKVIICLATLTVLCINAIAHTPESFGGLGMSVRVSKNGVTVAGVIPNSPAYYAGLETGDIIVSAGGIPLSAITPDKQVSLLRGKEGTIANLIVERNGKQIAISAKRAGITVQALESENISNWYGKKENLTAEEISFLASQKTAEGYEALGVVQNGLPISSDAQNLNAKAIQQISVKKAEESKTENKVAPSNVWQLDFADRETISFSIVKKATARIFVLNSKGVTVWQKSLGKLPAGAIAVNWDGAKLPNGIYQVMLEVAGKASAYRFELK